MKVVINSCYGGFGLSKEAQDLYCALMEIETGEWNATWKFYSDFRECELKRNDPVLVAVVEYLDEDADGDCANLFIVDIPDDVEWHIAEYDGIEWVAENHRTWR